MSKDETMAFSDLENEFFMEQKGEGSLSVFFVDGDNETYAGYDINPEDIEALYFEGIGVPRWEAIVADNVEKQLELYWERFNEKMDSLPLIGRARDTDAVVDYTADEIGGLSAECTRILEGTDHPKASRATQKIALAAKRAAAGGLGLRLKPSHVPNF